MPSRSRRSRHLNKVKRAVMQAMKGDKSLEEALNSSKVKKLLDEHQESTGKSMSMANLKKLVSVKARRSSRKSRRVSRKVRRSSRKSSKSRRVSRKVRRSSRKSSKSRRVSRKVRRSSRKSSKSRRVSRKSSRRSRSRKQ